MTKQSAPPVRYRVVALAVTAAVLTVATLVVAQLIFSGSLGFGSGILALLFILPLAALAVLVAAVVTALRAKRT